MEKREILQKLIDFYAKGTQSKFSSMCGLADGTVNMWLKRNRFNIDTLLKACPDVNYQFLLTGEGPITKTQLVKKEKEEKTIDKITLATNELLLVCSELKKQITDIRQELEEERRQHRETTALLNRVLDLYTQRMDVDYIRKAQDQYRTLAAEADITENSEAV